MRFRTLAIAAALSAGISHTGDAYAPQKGAERPLVAEGRASRLHRDVTWKAPHGALASLPSWQVMWDRDTDVPLRLWGPSIAAPGTSADASAAESFARARLAQHLALLAPGATTTDFVLVSNQTDPSGEVRTVAFAQHALGVRVLGGAIAFTFSHDRLVMMSSTALPHVIVRMPRASKPLTTIASAAKTWVGQAGFTVDVKAYGERMIVPVVRSRGRAASPDIDYRVADTVTVESSREPGAWNVFVDANDATPIARQTLLHFAAGKVLFNTPDRHPTSSRSAKPAPNANHVVGGAMTPSAADGSVTWATGSTTVTPSLVGPFVKITNKQGALATDTLTLDDGQSVTWTKAADEFADAQLTAFVAVSTAKAYVRENLNADLAWLDSQIPVVVNENSTCNAFSTGNDIHFFKKNSQCENTGRLVDVVYHEFGHSLHAQSVIPGVGSFDSSLSEGLADTLAAAITKDHGMGRGFFMSNAPLRDLDPVGSELKWPDDADGEPHNEGEIIGQALWDLRKALEAKLGASAGDERLRKIYYGIMQRASDIPSSFAEALIADDDDGNLANGTPNSCEINSAFGLHGLANPAVMLGLDPPVRTGNKVSITIHEPDQASGCLPPGVASATLTWAPKGGTDSDLPLTAAGEDWSAVIPTQPDGTVVTYHVTVTLEDGSTLQYPQNAADPEYQMYSGSVTKLWCADFEAGLDGWTVTATPANRLEWEAGMPMGLGRDPKAAHDGVNVLGIDLGIDDGLYAPRTTQIAESPEIDLQGNTTVRLQYYRWLNVEDGAYDQATISANDQIAWSNYASPGMPMTGGINHTDREWRFQDVDLSAYTASGKLKLKLSLTSDEGLELSGWNVDDVCLVIPGPPGGSCGNFNVDSDESCDDGNTTDGDGCSATCEVEGEDSGCCSAGTNPAGPLALSLLTLGLVARRRRKK